MKLFDCNNNHYSLKVRAVASVCDVLLQTCVVKPKDQNVPYLLKKARLPTLQLDSGEFLTSTVSICRYIWESAGKSVSLESDEWLLWTASILEPCVTRLFISESDASNLKPVLHSALKHLEKYLAGRSEPSLLVDVVIGVTLHLIKLHKGLEAEFLVPYSNVSKLLKQVSENPKVSSLLITKVDKEILTLFVAPSPAMPASKSGDTNAPVAEKHAADLTSAEIEAAVKTWNEVASAKVFSEPKHPILPKDGARNVLITSALPYVNNVPHLGNIVGSVLSADIFARFCRLRGYNTLYVCGTDEYGTATETKALEMGVTPREICDKFHKIHSDVYKWFNISFDHFGRTTTEKQTEIAQEIFKKLHNNGFLLEDSVEQLFCVKCSRFLADRFVEGTCPFCTYEDARGDQCDKCSKLINPTDLKQPRCKLCQSTPVLKTSKHMFLDLPKIEPQFRKWFDVVSNPSRPVTSGTAGWTQTARVISNAWLRDGLKPRCITRDLKWGTPVPLKGYESKVFYVWYDAPIGYISITANYTSEWRQWWQNPDKVQLYQFMAKDNVPFHALIFPSCEIGTGDKYTKVDSLIAIEYLNYEDAKFSKSRGVGVFGNDAQDTGIPSDVWRFYLMYMRPETQDTSFSWADLQLKNNSELLNNLGNFINRGLTFLFNNFGGVIPEIQLTEGDHVIIAEVNRELGDYLQLLENAKLRDAIRAILNISRIGNGYIQAHKPWELVKVESTKARSGSIMALCANICALIAGLLSPYMPETGAELYKQLNIKPLLLPEKFISLLKTGHKMNKPTPLFKKIENETIEELRKRFQGKQDSPAGNGPADSRKAGATAAPSGDANAVGDVTELEAKVTAQGNVVRELKTAKAPKDEIDKQVALLLQLKSQLAAATVASSGDANAVGDVMELETKVTAQGNVVRELKTSKAPKDEIDKQVALLLQLKSQLAAAKGEPVAPSSASGKKGKKKK